MKSIRLFVTGIVLAHFVINIIHGAAHLALCRQFFALRRWRRHPMSISRRAFL